MRRVARRNGAASWLSGLVDDADVRGDEAFPARPELPPLLFFALASWGACALLFGWSRTHVDALAPIACLAAIVAFVTVAVWWGVRVHSALFALLLGAAIGICAGCVGAFGLHQQQVILDGATGTWTLSVVSDGNEGAYSKTCLARIEASGFASAPVVEVRLDADQLLPRYGDRLLVQGKLSAPNEKHSEYCWQHGAAATLSANKVEELHAQGVAGALTFARNKAIDLLASVQPTQTEAGLLSALLCGWRPSLDEEVYRTFQVCGLAHLVAVSGAHLSLVVSFAALVLTRFRVPKRATLAIQLLLIASYLVFTAFPISAVRAAVMACAGMLSFTARRRASSLSALSACIALVIVVHPSDSLSVSFALSATSTLGIVLFNGLVSAWIRQCAPGSPDFVREALSLTLSSSVLSQALSVAVFSQLPLISPLANIVAGPLFAPLWCAGLAAVVAVFAIGAIAPFVLGVACLLARVLAVAIGALAAVPYACVPASISLDRALGLTLLASAALWLAWPRLTRLRLAFLSLGFLVIVAAFCLIAPLFTSTQLVMLDVGQGDAFLLRSGKTSVLIDTGNQDSLLREGLARQGIRALDAVVITHPDDDHMGSLASLAGVVQVRQVIVASDGLVCPCKSCSRLRTDAASVAGEDALAGIEVGDALAVGRWRLACLWPSKYADEGGNADSLCFEAAADADGDGAPDVRALMVGDAEHEQLQELVDSGAVGAVDILKVGHHGSKNALTPELAQAFHPALSLVSVGRGNRYGHPAANTIENLEQVGSRIVRTDESGDVVCEFSRGDIAVRELG